MQLTAQFPSKLSCLFKPYRNKILYGGRGGTKSWGIARALLMIGVSRPIRVLCTREVQKSIDQSVYRLLKDQIELLGLSEQYQVLSTTIRGTNGTEFYFSGLSDQTATSLKSYEGVDICWCEEAENIQKKSWNILIPTIRKSGSEIWISFNPQLESDETYQRFIKNTPPNSVKVKMNFKDNPWFKQSEMLQEMHHAKKTLSPEEFNHIWLGECMPAVEGAIYFNAMSLVEQEGRVSHIPYDPMLKVHVVLDLGFNDAMTLILVQKHSSEVRVIHYIEGRQRVLSDYSAELKELRFGGQRPNWGHIYLPHDGFSKRHQTGICDADILRQLEWTVFEVPNLSIKQGIDKAQQMFPRVYFNNQCERLIECLKRYRWNLNAKTGEGKVPLHDEFSHGADAFRYLAIIEDQLVNEDFGAPIEYGSLGYA